MVLLASRCQYLPKDELLSCCWCVQTALAEAELEEVQQQQQQSQPGAMSPGKLSRSSQSLNKGPHRTSKGSFRARISQDVLGMYTALYYLV